MYLRASYGASTVDTELSNHIRDAKLNGFPIGFYHYGLMLTGTSYSLADADQQAKFFADTIANAMTANGYSGYGDLMPVLDLESPSPDSPSTAGVTSVQILAWAKEFATYFKSYTGRSVMLYTSSYFYSQFGITGANNTLAGMPLWTADYYQYEPQLATTDTPPQYGGWNDWTVWQYSQTGTIQAYTGNVDLDWGPKDLAWIKPPATPNGVKAIVSGLSQITLSWNPNTDADLANYNVYLGGTLIGSTTNNYFNVSTVLTQGQTYILKVQAVDQYADVSASAITSVTYSNNSVTSISKQRSTTELRSINKFRLLPRIR